MTLDHHLFFLWTLTDYCPGYIHCFFQKIENIEFKTQYEKKLDKICEKQIQQISGTSSEAKNKIIRRLAQKGWETELIIKCLNRPIK